MDDYEYMAKLDELEARINRQKEILENNKVRLEQMRIDAEFIDIVLHMYDDEESSE